MSDAFLFNLPSKDSQPPIDESNMTGCEIEAMNILKENNIKFEVQHVIRFKLGRKYLYDFYIPSLNLLIEIDGIYWHAKGIDRLDEMNSVQRKNKKADLNKEKVAQQFGYGLIRVWEDEVGKTLMKKIEDYKNR